MTDWRALAEEIGFWANAGRRPTFWWRDDDAGRATPALERLLGLAGTLGCPLTVAVVPAWLDDEATARLSELRRLTIVQHGWNHANHARENGKKIELGGARRADDVLADLKRGLAVMTDRAGAAWCPVLVPPWNRIEEPVLARLALLGYRALSRFGPRALGSPLVEVNTHIDIVAWHDGRGFVGESEALASAVVHLRARRTGRADRGEPTGLLTHHAVHDEACWSFIGRFLDAVRVSGAVIGLPEAVEAQAP